MPIAIYIKCLGLATRTIAYLRNRLPTPAASGGSSGVSRTILNGVPTDLPRVKVFGCTAYLRLKDRYMDISQSASLYFYWVLR